MKKKIAVAMSGGVDSTVTAALLLEQGYDVQGVFMALAQPDLDRQVEHVRQVADTLHVPLTVVDLHTEFQEAVLGYFCSSYFDGKTPNPCVICNRIIKCGRLLEAVRKTGIDLLATGHYARIIRQNGIHLLCKGKDPLKDQSYFLHQLTQEQLRHLLFPLGEFTKDSVRQMAKKMGLQDVHGDESQDVCFLKDNDVAGFIARHHGEQVKTGPVVTLAGKKISTHQGIHHFTVGQRRGLGIPDATPYYVVELDPAQNAVIVGKKEDLWKKELRVKNVNWVAGKEPGFSQEYQVKIRYRHEPAPAYLATDAEGVVVRFSEPQRAITPGQFAVFYDGDTVLGGGEIAVLE